MADDSESDTNKQADVLPEPLHSLRVFNWILLVYSILFFIFYLLGFVWALVAYYNHIEVVIFSVVGLLNLVNTIAIVCFLYGMNKRKMSLVRVYLGLNGLTLLAEFAAVVCVYGFGDYIWSDNLQNLLSTIFVLLYEVIFIGANAFVWRLVCVQCRGWPSQPEPLRVSSLESDIALLRDSLEASIRELVREVDLLVERSRQPLGGPLASLSVNSDSNVKLVQSSVPKESISISTSLKCSLHSANS